jgi:plasmid stability protein
MPALTIRNIPDDVHRGLKALAARHGRSAEAEVRELIAAAVKPEGRLRMGEALAAIWAAGDDRRGTCDDRRCAGSRTGKSGEF